MNWTKNNRLAALVAERGLSTKGFRSALRALVKDAIPDSECDAARADIEPDLDPDEELPSNEEIRDGCFTEWFGYCPAKPAAFRIYRNGRDGIYGITVEVYEVEESVEIPDWKLEQYGNIADGSGPQLNLHILDRYDHEIVVPCEDLMTFMSMHLWTKEEKKDHLKQIRSRARVQHHTPIVVNLGIDVLQDVIYGLGLGQSRNVISERTGVPEEMVVATARVLAANSVNPKAIVKDTHARWRAAYDAVRELGVQL